MTEPNLDDVTLKLVAMRDEVVVASGVLPEKGENVANGNGGSDDHCSQLH